MTEWDDWIGRSVRSETYIDPAQANRMAVTLDREPDFREGDSLPAAWHWLYFHEFVPTSRLGSDGHPAIGVTMPPVTLPRRMWAGGNLEFAAPLRLGSRAERVSRIAAITPKSGNSGKLIFVTVESEILSNGTTTVRERQDIVYRELINSGSPHPPRAPENPVFSTRWRVNSTTLFRYSALTFNGHRIHYDSDYARSVEGYANLVVQGPFIATLLLDSAARDGHEVESFSYQARSPLLLPGDFTVNGRVEAREGALWAATPDGRLAMEAIIRVR